MSTKASSKQEISYKQVGQNIIVIVDGQQYSKKEISKEKRDTIKEMVIKFNFKNTVTLQKQIIAEFNKKTEEIKEKVAKVAKVERKVAKANKVTTATKDLLVVDDLEQKDTLSDSEIKRLKALLNKHKKTEAPKKNIPTRRTGEY